MQASRLLSILMLLQTRGRMSATQLAKAFEVSVRTIHRDIDQLSAAGIPVYADRGRSGGFQLMDGYRTKLTGLTPAEAEALFMAGLPGPAAQLGLSDTLTAARLKLKAALPAQADVERIASRFHLDPVAWFRGAEPIPALQTVARAVWSGHFLKLRYRSNGELYARKLGPLGLVLKGGVWYLVALSGSALRTYRVTAIEDAEICDEPIQRPKGFDLVAHWEDASRIYEAGVYSVTADIRLSPAGMERLDLLGPFVANTARRTASPPGRDGWVACKLPVEPGSYGVRELLRLGDALEVLGPRKLRDQMIATLAAMAGQYAG